MAFVLSLGFLVLFVCFSSFWQPLLYHMDLFGTSIFRFVLFSGVPYLNLV